MAQEAYYLDGSRNQQGPLPVAEIGRLIRGGTIRRDTLVWYAGMPEWRPAGQVSDFASLFVPGPPPPRPAPPPVASHGPAPRQRPASMAGPLAGQSRPVQAQHQPGAQYTESEPNGPVGLGGAIARCFRRYADFTGRAPRSEYWFWHLFYWLVFVVCVSIDGFLWSRGLAPVLTIIAMFVLLLPTLAGTVRRLHDTDHSGWMIFITLVPLIGSIVFLVFMCQRGTAGANRFGSDPFGADTVAAFD